jgi:hypothetical protein
VDSNLFWHFIDVSRQRRRGHGEQDFRNGKEGAVELQNSESRLLVWPIVRGRSAVETRRRTAATRVFAQKVGETMSSKLFLFATLNLTELAWWYAGRLTFLVSVVFALVMYLIVTDRLFRGQ